MVETYFDVRLQFSKLVNSGGKNKNQQQQQQQQLEKFPGVAAPLKRYSDISKSGLLFVVEYTCQIEVYWYRLATDL
jgi:hypothetical protein